MGGLEGGFLKPAGGGPERARRTALGPGREFDLIGRLLGPERPLPPEVRVGPGDDCAVLEAGSLALSTDLFVEGVHFHRAWLTPREIGFRAGMGALSDLAGVAAEPVAVFVSLAFPGDEEAALVGALGEGLREAAGSVGAVLLGGDVSSSPGPLVLDVVVAGTVERPVLRSGARPGDRVWVTGRLGGAAAAVRLLEEGRELPRELRVAFARPRARTEEARWLTALAPVHALIDLSDGLAGDAGHLAAASGVAVELDGWKVPGVPALAALGWSEEEVLRMTLAGGEDYELCLTAPPGALEVMVEEFEARFGIPLSPVGRVSEGEGLRLRRTEGAETEPMPWRGFDHLEAGAGSAEDP